MITRTIPVVFALILYIGGHFALAERREPFIYFFFVTSWWAYIIILDSILWLKSGKLTLLNRGLPEIVVISCGFWCVFELINLRLEDWFYINIPFDMPVRYLGYFLAYGTVVPALYLTAAAVDPLFTSLTIRPLRVRSYPARALTAGVILFFLMLLLPRYLFGFAWIFGIFLIDGVNYRAGYRSFMADLEKGNPGRLIAALLSGFICGFLWESWNFISPVRWVYTVPFLEGMKVFEMPLTGYIGFPVFAVETVAFYDLLQGIRKNTFARAAVVAAAAAVSVVSFLAIDRFTVFSYTTPVNDLAFLSDATKKRALESGARTNISLNPGMLQPNEADILGFINMKGLGYEHYLRLRHSGVSRAEGLKGMDDLELSRVLEEKNLRRVHVYQDAAKRY